jgi:hypothetical protein
MNRTVNDPSLSDSAILGDKIIAVILLGGPL